MSEPLSARALARLLAMAAEPPPAAADDGERYAIVRELGRGGMGVVHEAFDRRLGRRCALKTLPHGTDPGLRQRFAREATAAARLRHPHIAAVYDATPEHIAMQLIDGGPIGSGHRLSPRAAVALVRDAANALHHAHEQGIVHRDVKPSNLLVEGDHVFVVDFGLAKTFDADASASLDGAVVGTPAFMPPEQALGRADRIDARSDVYSLGATLHCCLAGAPPFAAADLPSLLRAVVEVEPRPTGIDADLDRVLARCLAKEPERRYPTARAFAEDLERWLRDEPVLARAPTLGYRLAKFGRRHRSVLRTAFAATALTAFVLVPIAVREKAARTAATESVELTDHVATVLQDAALAASLGDHRTSWQRLDGGIARARDFLARHEVPRVRHLLARMLQARGLDDEALRELDRAIAGEPGLIDARFARGLLLAAHEPLADERRDGAIADLELGLHDRSVLRDVDRLFGRGQLLRLQHRDAEAIAVLREVVEIDATHEPARLALAAAAQAIGDTSLALYCSASAVDLQHGYGAFYTRLRRALPTTMLGLDAALDDCSAALLEPADNALGLAHRGLVALRRALRLGDDAAWSEARETIAAAIADHDAVLRLHPDVAGARCNRAACWLVAEEFALRDGDALAAAAARDRADEDTAAALRLDPRSAAAHFDAGVVAERRERAFAATGRPDAAERAATLARSAFAEALRLAPPDWPLTAICRARLAEAGR